MDAFMTEILSALREDGKKAVRVFPPSAHVLLSFSERLAVEVVCSVDSIYHHFPLAEW